LKHNKVIFLPGSVEVNIPTGSTIMDAIHEARMDFDFPCGGDGRCGKCRVRVLSGAGEADKTEIKFLGAVEIQEGMRLACQSPVLKDMILELSESRIRQHNILLASAERTITVKPHLSKTFLELAKPSIRDTRPDLERFNDTLSAQSQGLKVEPTLESIRRLPDVIRSAGYQVTAVTWGNRLAAIEEADTAQVMLGMAFDIGTTTIVGYLMDLYTGKELQVVSCLNPQTQHGADVTTRSTFAERDQQGLKKLHALVINELNSLIAEAAAGAGISRSDIYALTVAGNTCMHHLFLGINPSSLALSPYVPVASKPLVFHASELAIKINPAGQIFVLPNIAGFVGADTVAVLLATEIDKSDEIKLMIDIGTNGEIVLGSKHRMVACSAAAGPAFEGAQISSGMRGAAGAIDHITFGKNVSYSVIGGQKPQGICGSALLDAVAGLLEFGLIDKKGRFTDPELITNLQSAQLKNCLIQHDGTWAFLLANEQMTMHGRQIMITQHDIRELQMAKGAIAAGVKILLDALNISINEVTEVLLAGAFGNYLDIHSACTIGLIPKELENRVRMVGNAAGAGAKLALLSSDEYQNSAAIAEAVEYVELGSCRNFAKLFAESMYF